MAVLTISDEQILDLILQLPEQQRTWLFLRLAVMQWPAWIELSKYGSQQASRVAAEKGMDWQQMSDEEREEFIDQILHERDK